MGVGAGGIGWHQYEEISGFADPAENISQRTIGSPHSWRS